MSFIEKVTFEGIPLEMRGKRAPEVETGCQLELLLGTLRSIHGKIVNYCESTANVIEIRRGEKLANTRWNQCTLFTKVSPEDLFDSWLVLELVKGPDFLGECHVDMGRVSLDDRPVWFPFSAKGSSSHRGSISQITTGGQTPPSARELARRLRMRGLAAGSQSQSEEQDDSSGQSSPCASSLLRPEVAWEVLGTLGPPGAVLTCRSAPTSRRGSAQSDRGAIGIDGGQDERGSAPSTPAMPRSLPPSRRGSFAIAVEEVINRSRRSSVAFQRVPDFLGRQLPEIPDGDRPDPAMLRNRRNSAWNPREVGYDRRSQFERTDSLRAINPTRRTSADFRGDFGVDSRNRQRKSMTPYYGAADGSKFSPRYF
ncbi:unnamed protein product [Allacma fusca]|uniref:Uncharacterized protein n=1 Tax=Allacma fusca TaxID=39272 RepID=A0A8J2PDT5_9HEXA|nr:unnamed protein product [Allacma fusca]